MVTENRTPVPTYSLLPPDYVRWTEADLAGDPLAHKWPVYRLTATELATLRIRVDNSVAPTAAHEGTVAGWTALRLRAHAANGRLSGRSSRDIANELWALFFSGPRPKYPFRGFDVLRCMDEAADSNGVAVWIDADPVPDQPNRYRPMRFHQRMAELEAIR